MSQKEKPDSLQVLKDLYMSIGEAYDALRDHKKNRDQVNRLHMEIKSQEDKIKDLLVLIRAHEMNSGDTLQICPQCNGAGALLRGPDDPEECLRCDGVGAVVKNQKPK
jgi:uncharacterized phage protein